MAIFKLGPDNFELFTLATHPVRTYTSSSSGVTGSVYVYARRSNYEKDAQSLAAFDDTKLQADSLFQPGNHPNQWSEGPAKPFWKLPMAGHWNQALPLLH